MSVPIAHVVRNGVVEGTHHGSAVVVDRDGAVLWSLGQTERAMFPRSSNKLMQGLAMLRAGLALDGRLLALACASHSGEVIHTDGVSDILSAAGLDTDALQCPPDYPLDPVERDTLVAQGLEPARRYMNCSGKHAAMLLTCLVAGWDTAHYLDPDHPLQLACRAAIEDCTGVGVDHVGVDGCGAPLMSTTLVGLARSFSRFAGPDADGHQARIATAVRAHPEYLSGTRRDEFALMTGVPGLIAKVGAEAVYGVGLADGRALAVKIDDGADRARTVVAAAILRDVLAVDSPVVQQQATIPVLGGGRRVGEIRAVLY